MKPIRVLVVDDSAFMRKLITDILTEDARIEVIGTARNGKDALRKIKAFTPDVITLDVEMPVMDGIQTLQHIMSEHPLPVVMLSSDDHAQKTVQAMTKGAVDFIKKPSGAISLNLAEIKQEIVDRVIGASEAKPLPDPDGNFTQTHETGTADHLNQIHAQTVIAIGTSTGGPKALEHILTELPEDFKPAILIVQHMPERFTKSLAERLDAMSHIHVTEAAHGEIIQSGTAYIAPGNLHMRIRETGLTYAIELSEHPAQSRHRPSVDVLFKSLSKMNHLNKLTAILTGMGKDGADGIMAIKQEDKHAIVLAQSQASSVVYGMPKAAIMTKHVDEVVALSDMAEKLITLVEHPRGK
ncbi:Protein-glutamate methylesterase [Lentibacillus sp. JNUCC-1]|uniref:protein-glutamate methylesterase/protein-glutamine glutaminase n=1 Tax=Lentibacillus sp. JNUCC-1 TaxID=2654513 RepID=UPI0012E7BC2F|nr:chemotaxis response regulator protein-glutamate methylesterase [Lentibacillus sp. JNUCC-1]MUV39941.1 Protein-glutamate methylesterase [Lentibacillus sp. JNUCC-1]